MIIGCPSCRRQFRLEDRRVRPGAKLRCARCSHTFPIPNVDIEATIPEAPRAAAPRPVAPRPAPPAGRPPASPVGGDAPLVLLADANRPVRTLLRPILAELGCRVETADDGTAAFKAVVTRQPVAIVASLHLGGLSGVAICEGVKGSPHLKGIKVALVGSDLSADLFNRETAQAYGADLFLEEGMPEETLRASLAAILPRLRGAGFDDTEDPSIDVTFDDLDGEEGGPPAGPPAEQIRRLARLMLSDLKLYNPDRFAQAVQSGQVLEIFKAELARGRDLVDQRFPGLPARQDLLQNALRDGIARENGTTR